MCDSHAIDYIGKWNKSVIELYACMRYVRIDKSFPIFIPESQLPPLWIPLMLFVSIFKIYFIIRKCDKGWEVSWFIFLQCLLLSFLVRWLIGGMFVNIKYLVCKLLPFFVLTVSWQYEASNLSSFRSTKIPFWHLENGNKNYCWFVWCDSMHVRMRVYDQLLWLLASCENRVS